MDEKTQHAALRRGVWTTEEDALLRNCMQKYGTTLRWRLVAQKAGLNRSSKSCRLRWVNYLCPKIKRGKFDEDEVDLIFRLHRLLGNRWSLIAGRIPGRTANDIKNYWNTHLSKKLAAAKNGQKVLESSTEFGGEVVKPQPQTILPAWSWQKTEDSSFPNQPPPFHDNNAVCGPPEDHVNLATSSDNIVMTEELVRTNFGVEEFGSIRDFEFLLDGFGQWDQDSHLDVNLWGDFGDLQYSN